MTETLTKDQIAASVTRAGWESATVQNLNPLLSEDAAEQVWRIVLDYRDDDNAEKAIVALRELGATLPEKARNAITFAIAELRRETAPASSSSTDAGAPAKG